MTVDRIDACFAECARQARPALIAYLCVGHPSIEDTVACALAAIDAGADLLELGVPFSDPTADGPVIAAAAYRAIQSGGGSLRAALEVARSIRRQRDAALVLFTYYNPIVAFGDTELPRVAADAGIDALLVVDLPPEEGAELRAAARAAELGFIPLLAPTSGPERERIAFEGARGFVYYVSLTGVTGANPVSLTEAGRRAVALRERAGLPVVVGFGIDGAGKAREAAAQGVSGIVVGTAIVRAIDGAMTTQARAGAVGTLVASLRAGIEAGG